MSRNSNNDMSIWIAKIICFIFGHKILIKDWYPHDEITKVVCMRCDTLIDTYKSDAQKRYQNDKK